MRRVVITGMGAITPVGLSVEEFWNSVKEGKTNFAEVTRFDSTNYRAHMAAEINNFNPKDYMDFKSAKRMELFSQYAVAAAKEAIEQSGLDMTKEDPFRVGCSVGSGIGSMQVVEKSCEILNTKGPGRLNPLMIPLLISNMASGNVSIQFGLRGKNINVVTACATGTHSIGEAYRTIQCSDADVMVAGGTEAAITPTGFPKRPRIICLHAFSLISSESTSVISVSTNPGAMAFTVIPRLPSSLAIVFVRPITPALDAA